MRKFYLILIIGALLFSVGCLGEEAKKAEMTLDTSLAEVTGNLKTTQISASDFMGMYLEGEDFVLIDVRTDEEYNSGHIPGAVHIPYNELDARIGALGLSKDARVVVYCEAGVRSKKGANALVNLGFTNIVDVSDGMRGWRELGGDIAIPGVEAPPSGNDTKAAAVLITSEELSEDLDSYKVIFLGTENQYQEGHIPGALYINPLEDLSDPDGAVQHLLMDIDDFEALMSRLGISEDDSLVLYDDQPDRKYAARFFWILDYYGHGNAAVLDGGLSMWRKSGGGLSTATAEPHKTNYTSPGMKPELIASTEYVSKNLDNPLVRLVDATTFEEFENEGHIPGAVLIEPEDTLNPDGTIKKTDELLSLYTSKGMTKDKEIITYCHTGYRGSVIWFELKHLLNYPYVRLYDGSLEEWNLRGMPLESGSFAITTLTPAPKEENYMDVEPKTVIEKLDGSETVQMYMWDSLRLGDAYIYITGDFNGCIGLVWWTFNIYHDTPMGGRWEGKTTPFSNYEVYDGQDISDNIHKVSDAMDDYKIVVKRWSVADGLTIEIS